MRHATAVSFVMMCDTGCMSQGIESLQRQCADPFDNSSTVIDIQFFIFTFFTFFLVSSFFSSFVELFSF